MDDMNELQLACFEIISCVGAAKSCYVESFDFSKKGDFEAAEKLISDGDSHYSKGHAAHMKLLQADAAGERNGEAPLILLHAEDQMSGTEIVKLLALNFLDVYRELSELKK